MELLGWNILSRGFWKYGTSPLQLITFTTLQLSLQISRVSTSITMFTSRQNYFSCSNKDVYWIHFGLGFPCSNVLWRKSCRLFWQASPHFLADKQLSPVSYLTKPCDERKPWLYLWVLQAGQRERRQLSVRWRAENIRVVSAGGKSRIMKRKGGRCSCVDSCAMCFSMSVRIQKSVDILDFFFFHMSYS